MATFLLPRQQHIQLTKTDLRVYTINAQNFTTTHLQINRQRFSECDYPVCLQTSPGGLRPAVLQHQGTVAQKGLSMLGHFSMQSTVEPLYQKN